MGKKTVRIVVAVIGALALVAAAFAGGLKVSQANAQTVNITIAGQTVAVNSTAASVIQTNVDSLQSENAALRSSLATAAKTITTTATTTTTATATVTVAPNPPPSGAENGAGTVRHQGPLTITDPQSGYVVDLDAPSSDSSWGRDEKTGDAVADGPIHGSSSVYVSGAEWFALEQGGGGYDFCSVSQKYNRTNIPVGDLTAGTQICVRTSAKRYGMLTVTKEATPKEVDFDVTVWEK